MHCIVCPADPSSLLRTLVAYRRTVVEVSTPVYWRYAFASLCSTSDLVEFTVLDVETLGPTRGKVRVLPPTLRPHLPCPAPICLAARPHLVCALCHRRLIP